MNTSLTPTPETDKAESRWTEKERALNSKYATPERVREAVAIIVLPPWDFARTLERQRDTALSDLHSLRQQADAMAGALREVSRISDDYHPAHERDSGQALAEMREDLRAAIDAATTTN